MSKGIKVYHKTCAEYRLKCFIHLKCKAKGLLSGTPGISNVFWGKHLQILSINITIPQLLLESTILMVCGKYTLLHLSNRKTELFLSIKKVSLRLITCDEVLVKGVLSNCTLFCLHTFS